jgi:capsule biosynthesis phosphatase
MKRLIVDLDDTICSTVNGDYQNSIPDSEFIKKLHEYQKDGFDIVINTSRNVRTHKGNVGKINAQTLPMIIQWLDNNNVPYDEVYVGKPWCGHEGFYIDDKAIRPSEFKKMGYNEIMDLLKKEKIR